MRRVGIYAGSFNPFHVGHLDIFLQAKQQFDEVILAIGKNPDKETIQRLEQDGIPIGIGIQHTSIYVGLLSDELKRWAKHDDVTLIRGLRNIHDLGEEQNLATFVRSMYPELKVVYFLCKPEHAHLSSSALRGIRKFSEEEYQKYIPKSR